MFSSPKTAFFKNQFYLPTYTMLYGLELWESWQAAWDNTVNVFHSTTKKNVFSQKFLFITEKYSNWQGVGQNVARDIARGVAGKVDVHKLIGHWFNQILYFDPEAVKSFGYVHCKLLLLIYLSFVYVKLKH